MAVDRVAPHARFRPPLREARAGVRHALLPLMLHAHTRLPKLSVMLDLRGAEQRRRADHVPVAIVDRALGAREQGVVRQRRRLQVVLAETVRKGSNTSAREL